jgi:hypothetical protein
MIAQKIEFLYLLMMAQNQRVSKGRPKKTIHKKFKSKEGEGGGEEGGKTEGDKREKGGGDVERQGRM